MIGLVLLGSLALTLRICLVLAVSRESSRPLAFEHGRIAENLLAGRGFSITFLGTEGPTSQQAPFYPVLLAAAYRAFGVAKPAAILAVQLLQCVVGTGLVLAVVWLAWSLLAEWPVVGWIAGLGAAIYPPHVYMVTHLQVVVWATTLLTLLLVVAVSPRWRATWSGAALIGLLAAALLLVEPILSLSLPIVALVFWLAEGQCSRHTPCAVQNGTRRVPTTLALGRLALMAGVAAVVIAPWIVRNWRVHGEFVFIKSSFGYAFWQGNNPASGAPTRYPRPRPNNALRNHDGTLAGIDQAMWEARHETIYIDDLLLKPGGYRPFLGLSEPQRSRLLGRQAWEFIRGNPAAYGRLCLVRLRYFLLFDETNPKADSRIYRLATVAWLVLAGVGLLATLGRVAATLAHLRHLRPGHPVPYAGNHLGPLPHPHRAAGDGLGGGGPRADGPAMGLPAVDQSQLARPRVRQSLWTAARTPRPPYAGERETDAYCRLVLLSLRERNSVTRSVTSTKGGLKPTLLLP